MSKKERGKLLLLLRKLSGKKVLFTFFLDQKISFSLGENEIDLDLWWMRKLRWRGRRRMV